MAIYRALVHWQKQIDEAYLDNKYSRGHTWTFEGGVSVPASSSPHIVPLPYSIAENVDPEEAFVASLSSCHMLFFLAMAAKKRYIVESYQDNAFGEMAKKEGKIMMTRVTLVPKIVFSGERIPTALDIEKLHHLAHEQCFIANSVKTEVVVEIPE
ncbi:OsmC family protein [Thalassotalea sp. 1_MG-2023]|uniref:OsmC family protein n=1 Tax=Thalassotalea sp. 1_MG-2023 TaxID=3062680 RepID=UPI0026E124D1|nr:OsmC family protein [Thalassotalea sp. 1_MG-2023]MDO6427434.1 OsmC family protein [Thalassotalea sp. 1_MG-2023]